MSARDSEPVVQFLREVAGDHLRSVLQYDEADYRVLYLRDDLQAGYEDGDRNEVVAALRRADPASDVIGRLGPAGELHSTVRLYDETVTIHVKQRGDFGTFVTLDPAAAGQLTGFLSRLMRVLDRHSPQSFDARPGWMRDE